MTDLKALPIGIEDFEKLRRKGCYYADKTNLIKELLSNVAEVNLFTRPRRFGKSLNMSMLKCFFEIGADKTLFEGLEISKEKELCEKHMGQYPVIHLTLKQVSGETYEDARMQLWSVIKAEAERFDSLQGSSILNARDKQNMMNLSMGIGNLAESILLMSRILHREYGKKAVILIDEYDVPLQKAEQLGYYPEMVRMISQVFGYGMKTNPHMEFAVITGCLKIAKESIFTGFNNVSSYSILDEQYNEWFGFTEKEIKELLDYYGKSEYHNLTKDWYDGYLFGNIHVYCPWDAIKWCEQLVKTSKTEPQNFWANTSGNDMIIRYAETAADEMRDQLGKVIEGESVWKNINQELTYGNMYQNMENMWSILLMTGYLTAAQYKDGKYELMIPNKEIQILFRQLIQSWFTQKVLGDNLQKDQLFQAIEAEDEQGIEEYIQAVLSESISCWDGSKTRDREAFYHGLMLGVLNSHEGWTVKSNRESGDGRLDLVTYPRNLKQAVIFEFKYVKDGNMDSGAREALEQIENQKYDEYFIPWYPEKITRYGIAFYKKYCKVLKMVD